MLDYYIRQFSEAQKDITEFIVRHRDGNTEELLNWRYRKLSDIEDVNALAIDGNRLVGLESYFIRKLLVEGKEVSLADSGHTQVEKDYQGKGIFSELLSNASHDVLNKGVQFLFGIPTHNAMRIFLKQEWEYIGNILLYSKRLNIYSKLLSFIPSEPICRFLNKVYVGMTTFLSVYPFIKTRNFTFYEVEKFSDQYEILCRKVNELIPIMRFRDKGFLTWRFKDKPFKQKTYKIYELTKGDQLIGYVVLLFNPDSKEVILVDFLAERSDMPVLMKMTLKYLRSLSDRNISKIIVGLSQKHLFGKVFRFLGFSQSRDKIPIIIKTHNQSDRLNKLSLNIRNWHITYADKDNV